MFLLEESSGVWHRPDARKLPRMIGFETLCGELFEESAQAFRVSRAITRVCHTCEERAEERGLKCIL